MQMSAAHQCMNRTHPQDAYQSAIAKRADELVTAVALPSGMRKKCLFAQVRPQLRDDSESVYPFARFKTPNMQFIHDKVPSWQTNTLLDDPTIRVHDRCGSGLLRGFLLCGVGLQMRRHAVDHAAPVAGRALNRKLENGILEHFPSALNRRDSQPLSP